MGSRGKSWKIKHFSKPVGRIAKTFFPGAGFTGRIPCSFRCAWKSGKSCRQPSKMSHSDSQAFPPFHDMVFPRFFSRSPIVLALFFFFFSLFHNYGEPGTGNLHCVLAVWKRGILLLIGPKSTSRGKLRIVGLLWVTGNTTEREKSERLLERSASTTTKS